MENEKLDIEKAVEEMRTLRDSIQDKIDNYEAEQEQKGEPSVKINLHEIRYWNKMKFAVDGKEELVEKYVYRVLKEIDGQFQFEYYDENMQLLGIQKAINKSGIITETDEEMILFMDTNGKSPAEKKEIEEALGKKDEQSKTLEEMEQLVEEKNKDKETTKEPKEEKEAQQLPGVQEGPQLTREEVNSGDMEGPKTSLNQIVDGVTLANAIGIQGEYMKLVRADKIREYIPDAEIPATQRTVPIVIFPDGTANLIGEDKLKLSSIEGTNSTDQHTTVTNDGQIRSEQNIETFNIVSKGNMHTIAVGYDENGGRPLEVKYGRRDIDDPTQIAYSELEITDEGPIKKDDEAYKIQKDASLGINKGDKIREDAVKIYTEQMNIVKEGPHGEKLGYDYELGRQLLEERWEEEPNLSLEELIESQQHATGPRKLQ